MRFVRSDGLAKSRQISGVWGKPWGKIGENQVESVENVGRTGGELRLTGGILEETTGKSFQCQGACTVDGKHSRLILSATYCGPVFRQHNR